MVVSLAQPRALSHSLILKSLPFKAVRYAMFTSHTLWPAAGGWLAAGGSVHGHALNILTVVTSVLIIMAWGCCLSTPPPNTHSASCLVLTLKATGVWITLLGASGYSLRPYVLSITASSFTPVIHTCT